MAREQHSGNGSPDTMSNAAAGAGDVAEEAKTKLRDVAEPLKEKVQDLAQQQKNMGAEQISVLARAIHGAAEGLQSDMPKLADTIHDAGARLERTAADFRERDFQELVDDFNEIGRKQPALFFGGAVIAGFVLARFLKSSAENVAPEMRGDSHGYPA
jgi:hypothetical protein